MSIRPRPSMSPPTDRQVSAYISEMATELWRLAADRPRFRTISYLLDMVRLEAERAAKDLPAEPSEAAPAPEMRPAAAPAQASGQTDKQVCTYIAETCTELRSLTLRPRFKTLSLLLDNARLEAERTANDLPA